MSRCVEPGEGRRRHNARNGTPFLTPSLQGSAMIISPMRSPMQGICSFDQSQVDFSTLRDTLPFGGLDPKCFGLALPLKHAKSASNAADNRAGWLPVASGKQANEAGAPHLDHGIALHHIHSSNDVLGPSLPRHSLQQGNFKATSSPALSSAAAPSQRSRTLFKNESMFVADRSKPSRVKLGSGPVAEGLLSSFRSRGSNSDDGSTSFSEHGDECRGNGQASSNSCSDSVIFFHGINGLELACESGRVRRATSLNRAALSPCFPPPLFCEPGPAWLLRSLQRRVVA